MTLDFMSSEESANGSDIDDDKFIEKPHSLEIKEVD